MTTVMRGPRDPAEGLTPRQREVVKLMAKGLTNGQIADELGVSLSGAKWHVSEVLSRLGASSREEAVDMWDHESSVRQRMNRGLAAVGALFGLKAAMAAVAIAVAAGVGAILAATTFSRDDDTGVGLTQVTTADPITGQLDVLEREMHRQRSIMEGLNLELGTGPILARLDLSSTPIILRATDGEHGRCVVLWMTIQRDIAYGGSGACREPGAPLPAGDVHGQERLIESQLVVGGEVGSAVEFVEYAWPNGQRVSFTVQRTTLADGSPISFYLQAIPATENAEWAIARDAAGNELSRRRTSR